MNEGNDYLSRDHMTWGAKHRSPVRLRSDSFNGRVGKINRQM